MRSSPPEEAEDAAAQTQPSSTSIQQKSHQLPFPETAPAIPALERPHGDTAAKSVGKRSHSLKNGLAAGENPVRPELLERQLMFIVQSQREKGLFKSGRRRKGPAWRVERICWRRAVQAQTLIPEETGAVILEWGTVE